MKLWCLRQETMEERIKNELYILHYVKKSCKTDEYKIKTRTIFTTIEKNS